MIELISIFSLNNIVKLFSSRLFLFASLSFYFHSRNKDLIFVYWFSENLEDTHRKWRAIQFHLMADMQMRGAEKAFYILIMHENAM